MTDTALREVFDINNHIDDPTWPGPVKLSRTALKRWSKAIAAHLAQQPVVLGDVATAVSKSLSHLYGGCFKPDHSSQKGECADSDCFCIREIERVLSKPLTHFWQRNQAKNDAGFEAIQNKDPQS